MIRLAHVVVCVAVSSCIDGGPGIDDLSPATTGASVQPLTAAPAPGWHPVTALARTADASTPRVAMDASGGAIALWASGGDLLASHYVPAALSWSQAVVIDAGEGRAREITIQMGT